MNICFVSHTSDLGGAEKSLIHLVKSLQSNYGIKALVVVPSVGPICQILRKNDIQYIISRYYWWTTKRGGRRSNFLEHKHEFETSAVALSKKITKFNTDLIITNTSVICVGALTANLINVPHIWHVRELGEKDHGFIFKFGIAFTAKFINKYSVKVIFNSKATFSEFSKYINITKSKVIYNSISINKSDLNRTIKNPYKHTGSFKLLIAGTISEKKGQVDAIKATSLLLKEGLNVELTILGRYTNIEYYSKISRLILDTKCPERFNITPFLKNPYPLFKKCNALLVCSKNEAFGRTIVEAMLIKKLVIATNTGGVTEIVQHMKNGLLYTPRKYRELASLIKLAIQNRIRMNKISDNGYKIAIKKFNDKNYSGRLFDIYSEAVSYK